MQALSTKNSHKSKEDFPEAKKFSDKHLGVLLSDTCRNYPNSWRVSCINLFTANVYYIFILFWVPQPVHLLRSSLEDLKQQCLYLMETVLKQGVQKAGLHDYSNPEWPFPSN